VKRPNPADGAAVFDLRPAAASPLEDCFGGQYPPLFVIKREDASLPPTSQKPPPPFQKFSVLRRGLKLRSSVTS